MVGEQERTNGTVNVRTQDNQIHGEVSMADLIQKFKHLQDNHILKSEESF